MIILSNLLFLAWRIVVLELEMLFDRLFHDRFYLHHKHREILGKSPSIKSVLHCDKTTLSVLMFCPLFYLVGQYEADGSIETIPFFGKGGFTLSATDYEIRVYPKSDITEKDNRKYMKVVDFNEESDLKGELDFNLENLYNGNEKLSEAMHKFIKTNPKFLTEYLQKPIFDANFQKIIDTFNKAFENIPVNGLIV